MTFDLQATPTIFKVCNDKQTLLIADTALYPDWRRSPGSEHIRSWLGVPLIAGGRVFGLCSLDMVRPDGFTDEHVRLAEALVVPAATSMQNAQLFEEVRLGRTQMQVLSRRLVEVQETERRLIARELHDDAGQALAALMVGLKLLERDAAQPDAVLRRAAELRKTADGVLDNLHRLAMDLRPASLDHLGLVPSLQQYLAAVSHQTELSVRFEALGLDGVRLAPDAETNIYRIVQEALTNIVRHAQASHADVLLEGREQGILLIIEDNGIGFDYDEALRRGRLGLSACANGRRCWAATWWSRVHPGPGQRCLWRYQMAIRILIADDHGVLRAGLRSLLNAEPDMEVIGEAADGNEALRQAENLRPDVLLLDINMPGLTGIEVTQELKATQPQIAVLILTVHEDYSLLQEAVRVGAVGYIIKRAVVSSSLSTPFIRSPAVIFTSTRP